ncbi:GNAT family N-acetyltransferase [Pseudooceanicola sp.]|uniref:GNAT family N-acetyltransferase n=1 Tax=Pseudooceanicola sp. TaxID=1914328 RepID=UPI002608844B|nr:GNAT family N-acetyltransferase [Pseudooceanicola sp.]MDF1855378.1 GNAT family N-acetyltransferase [Pseudooceanicola sp.]
MTAFALRRATPADAAPLSACFERAYAAYVARIPDLPEVATGLAEDIAAHIVWVAESPGGVVGGLVLVLEPDRAHLANVAVDPGCRGLGLGAALIAQAEALARAAGRPVIGLATHAEMPENLRLYRHLGWCETGRDGARVFMEKPL